MRILTCLVAASTLLMPLPALAQAGDPAATISSERRLSPEQIEAVLADAARKREASDERSQPEAIEREDRPPIQGEIGVSVGTGGHREVFGTAIYPMGDDGAAAISFDFVDLGKRRDRR